MFILLERSMIKMCVRRVLNAYQLASMGKNTVVSYLASRSFFCLGFLLVFSHINITNRCKCNLHCCFYCRILILFCQFLFFFFLYFVKSSLWVIKKTHRRSFLRPFFHGAKTIEIFFFKYSMKAYTIQYRSIRIFDEWKFSSYSVCDVSY